MPCIRQKSRDFGLPAGMTLIELLLALTILAMVLAGVSTLAFAMASVKNSTDDTSSKQAYVRFAETQLGDMIRHAKLVCYASDTQVVLWVADTNADGQMNVSEMALIATGASRNSITLTRFTSVSDPAVTLSTVGDQAGQWWLAYAATANATVIVPVCSGVTFAADAAAPATRYVSFVFTLSQDKEAISYCVSARLQAWAGYVLDSGNNIVSDDD
jgi:prepilin-type N-terminal cleavage/methylation domain-containing protein